MSSDLITSFSSIALTSSVLGFSLLFIWVSDLSSGSCWLSSSFFSTFSTFVATIVNGLEILSCDKSELNVIKIN